jgi:hypothetical protein
MLSVLTSCSTSAKKENDAILQSMHDNLDLLSLLNILDSTDNVIGEKFILKEKVENSKKEKLKGETGEYDSPRTTIVMDKIIWVK